MLLWVSGPKLEESMWSLNTKSQTLPPLRAFEATSAWTQHDCQCDVISRVRVQSAVDGLYETRWAVSALMLLPNLTHLRARKGLP